MIWFTLSIFTAFGISLILTGWSSVNILPAHFSAPIGGIITLSSLFVGYRYYLQASAERTNVALRGPRMKVRNSVIRFVEYCNQYKTRLNQNMVPDTHELSGQITEVSNCWTAEKPLQICGLDSKLDSLASQGRKLQRLFDRQQGLSGGALLEIEDQINSTLDRISDVGREITSLLDKFIT